ncbi:MAG TPA: putative urea ABC transporter substrate-binding protein [Candidatus Limnocylindrales bacterium]|nr:putative urea ABC transporter substrate-binding protein [Candidatus Limnocylindrales bacterium]
MLRRISFILAFSLIVGTALAPSGASAEPKKKFKIAWSIYVGWMPWGYLSDSRIIEKHARENGIEIEIVQINDYVESINQYTAGQFDGCSMTNMDALTIPAAGGVDSTGLIVGDFSNGNDGIVLKKKTKLEEIKGQDVHLVELSVSHYLLARALASVGLSEKDIEVVNISDADIVGIFASESVTAAVTWNPQLSEIARTPDAHVVFDSSRIPGEIIDLMVVNTKTLQDNPAFGKALVGAWYEVLGLLADKGEKGKAAREAMAKASGTDLAGFEAQLATTRMFYTPKEAADFAASAALTTTMDHVRKFSFEHGLLGAGAKSADAIGIQYPGGKTAGDASNIMLRFDNTFMAAAAK